MDFSPTWPLHVTPLIAFGLMLIVGAGGGYAAHRFSWLPSITGFMMVGFICGPSVLGLLSHEAIVQSRILIDVSLALILYRLGLSLDLKHLWQSPGLFFCVAARKRRHVYLGVLGVVLVRYPARHCGVGLGDCDFFVASGIAARCA